MGQINTNNYPAVDSLLDADLLIVENATHGTGTTTPKQLRENAIGTDPLQTTAQTVTGAINEIFEMATDTVVGLELGKMTSFSDGVIVTDIDLHRTPVAGDRILFYHGSAVASPSSLTTYNDGVAVTTTIGDFSLTHPAGLTLMKCVALGDNLRWQTVQDIASGYTAGIGISINGTTINNSAPQLGDDIAYSRVDTVTSGALGYFSADADCLVMDFRTDAEPYNGGYTLRLTTTGASFKYAVLQDKAGNNYAEEIPLGSLVMCKSNVSGTGSEADPVVVTVLEIGNVEMAHDVEVLKDICITEKTASGNPITVTDALPYPAVSLSAEIEASQDLHGQSAPYVGGAGKNKVPMTVSNLKTWNTSGTWADNVYTLNNTTIEILTDAANNVTGIKTNTGTGGASGLIIFKLSDNTLSVKTGDIITGCPTGGATNKYMLNVSGTPYSDTGSGGTCAADATGTLNLDIFEGAELSSAIWYPMIRDASAPSGFAPWENKCPISGRTETSVTTRNEDNTDSHTATIQLGQTVYGGTLNVTTGVLTVKTQRIVYNGSETWTASNGSVTACMRVESPVISDAEKNSANNHLMGLISNMFTEKTPDQTYIGGENNIGFAIGMDGKISVCQTGSKNMVVDDWKTWLASNPLQVEYKLATPTTIQLTPTQLTMLKGYNRLSSDGGGEITLTYKADRLAAIEAALAQTGA